MKNRSLLYGTSVCTSKQITIKISFHRSEFVFFSYLLYKNAHRLPPDRRPIVRVRCIFTGTNCLFTESDAAAGGGAGDGGTWVGIDF